MGLTAIDIADMKDGHYQLLIDEDTSLSDHVEKIVKLSPEQQAYLAKELILQCPDQEFKQFHHQIEGFRNLKELNDFYRILSDCYHIKGNLRALVDPRLKNPQERLLSTEFNPELFAKHKSFVEEYLGKHGSAIADRLINIVPYHDYQKIAERATIVFPELLVTYLEEGIVIKHLVDSQLLGEKPELFFTDEDFDVGICLKFSNLISSLIKDKVDQIADRLALSDSKQHHSISFALANMSSNATNQEDPLRKIAARFSGQAERAQQMRRQDGSSIGTNPNGVFGKGKEKKGNSAPQVTEDACCSKLTKCTIL